MIQQTEHEERGDQRLLVVAAKSDQKRCIEYADSCRRVAGEAQQGRGDEDGGDRKDTDGRSGRNQTYMASAAAPRSKIPITICRRTTGPEGSRTGHRLVPMFRGEDQHHTRKLATPRSSAAANH